MIRRIVRVRPFTIKPVIAIAIAIAIGIAIAIAVAVAVANPSSRGVVSFWEWTRLHVSALGSAKSGKAEGALQRERGRALFQLGNGLTGRLSGHDANLPAMATRCANCHSVTGTAQADGAATPAAAPALGRERLTSLQARRGGPPSRFDAASFCRLLATGRDPADVLVALTMPRYAAGDSQCGDLWAYLTSLP